MDNDDMNLYNIKYDYCNSNISINNDIFTFYAHPNEPLAEHLIKTSLVFKNIVNNDILKNFHKNLVKEEIINLSFQEFKNIIFDAINFHDYGKISFKFQEKLNKENIPVFKAQEDFLRKYDIQNIKEQLDSNHSFTSALLFLFKYNNLKNNKLLIFILSYIILGHHTNLKDINIESGFLYADISKSTNITYQLLKVYLGLESNTKFSKLQKLQKECAEDIKNLKSPNLALLYNYLYSTLITSDVIASSSFKKGLNDDFFHKNHNNRISDTLFKKMKETFFNVDYNKNWDRKLEDSNSINDLRLQMFQEASENLNNALNKKQNNKLFYLKMPTGAGKTNVSMKLALDLVENTDVNRIIYAMPFINIIEQNYDVVSRNYGLNEDEGEIRKIYSGTETIYDEEEDLKTQLIFKDQVFNFPLVFTTFVSLFNSLIQTGKSSKYLLNSLTNSVIILDEIQSWPVKNWSSLYFLINEIAYKYNIYFIIMSATLPSFESLKLDKQGIFKYGVEDLIKNPEKYFSNQLFKRTEVKDYEVLDIGSEDFIEYYLEHIKENFNNGYKRGLIVLNTIKSSRQVFDLLYEYKDQLNFDIDLLNSSLLPISKSEIISRINNTSSRKNYILVSTQSIEAGVDVSFDFVFRDFATMDSIEQVRGRCNRSGELYSRFNSADKKGNIYITNIKSGNKSLYKYIYNDVEKLTRLKESLKLIKNKLDYNFLDLNNYYKEVSNKINILNDKNEDKFILTDRENINNFIHFDFSKLADKETGINIIDDSLEQYSIFVATDIEIVKNNYETTIKNMSDIELKEKYIHNSSNFNFTYKEIIYLKNINDDIIKTNYVDGDVLINEYKNMVKEYEENNEFSKYYVLKKEFSSILYKFIFNIHVSTEEIESQVNILEKSSFFYILPKNLIGEDKNLLYSTKRGFNHEFFEKNIV